MIEMSGQAGDEASDRPNQEKDNAKAH
jgi:hypothetical protein